MNPDTPLASEDVITLATEHWRLGTWLATVHGASTALARHSLQQMGNVLARWQVEAVSLDGRAYDAGLAANVIDTIGDATLPAAQIVIDETVSPLIIWRGQVLRAAEVVVRRGTKASS